MAWTKETIIKELKALYRKKGEMSYNRLAKSHQSLVSAAAYHFGSYRTAVEAADIDYAAITRRPRWTRDNIVELIRAAQKKGEDLHWSAVTKRGDELGKAAFASLQPRLFGRWDKALEAAGLEIESISRYKRWDKASIVEALKQRAKAGDSLSSGTLQKSQPGLHAAAVRYFSGYENALREAGIDPEPHRRRRRWDQATVIAGIKAAVKEGIRPSDSEMRRHDAALYGAAVRLFGNFTAAREAAGVKLK
jgi:hypothetical protein